jgi:hypothetical protein
MKDFMIQGGDPEHTGYGGSKKNIKGEFKNNGVFTGTGVKVTLYTNNSKSKIADEYTYILFGDVDGNGLINSNDAGIVLNHIEGSQQLTGAYFYAADLDFDGDLTQADIDMIKKHAAGDHIPPDIGNYF